MLKFERKNDWCPHYDVTLGHVGIGTIRQCDDWEMPRRPRWTLHLFPQENQCSRRFYYDTLRDAKEGLASLLVHGIHRLVDRGVVGPSDHKLRRAAQVG